MRFANRLSTPMPMATTASAGASGSTPTPVESFRLELEEGGGALRKEENDGDLIQEESE